MMLCKCGDLVAPKDTYKGGLCNKCAVERIRKSEVKEIIERALFDLQDLPESPYNKSARADLWYALQNQATQRDLENNHEA